MSPRPRQSGPLAAAPLSPLDAGPVCPSLQYYDAHAESYARATRRLDMSGPRDRFMALLPCGGHILDAGCGSGRDSAAFRDAGFLVTAIDGSPAIAAEAEAFLRAPVAVVRHEEVHFAPQFHGVWASATLLHVPRADLAAVFARYRNALLANGVMFCSFKVGDGEATDRTGRRFTNFSLDGLRVLVAALPGFRPLSVEESADGSRADVRWVQALLRAA